MHSSSLFSAYIPVSGARGTALAPLELPATRPSNPDQLGRRPGLAISIRSPAFYPAHHSVSDTILTSLFQEHRTTLSSSEHLILRPAHTRWNSSSRQTRFRFPLASNSRRGKKTTRLPIYLTSTGSSPHSTQYPTTLGTPLLQPFPGSSTQAIKLHVG